MVSRMLRIRESRGFDKFCSKGCESIVSSERMLARLEANGVPTKRTRKEMARG